MKDYQGKVLHSISGGFSFYDENDVMHGPFERGEDAVAALEQRMGVSILYINLTDLERVCLFWALS